VSTPASVQVSNGSSAMFHFGGADSESTEVDADPVQHVEIAVGRAADIISPTMVSKQWTASANKSY